MNLIMRLLVAGRGLLWRVFRPLTMGVRLILAEGQRVLLVQHTFDPLWYLPGGGVRRGETLEQAMRREVREELAAELGDLRLFGAYSSFFEGKSDHVLIFLCQESSPAVRTGPEIARCAWFSLDDLPPDLSPGTSRRLEEYRAWDGEPILCRW